MQILNIDDFAKINRQITLGGITHPVQELDVQQFIDNLKAANDLEIASSALEGNDRVADSFEQGVRSIHQSIPTLSEDQIRKLKLPAMTAVMQFIRGELDPDIAKQHLRTTDDAEGAEKKPV